MDTKKIVPEPEKNSKKVIQSEVHGLNVNECLDLLSVAIIMGRKDLSDNFLQMLAIDDARLSISYYEQIKKAFMIVAGMKAFGGNGKFVNYLVELSKKEPKRKEGK